MNIHIDKSKKIPLYRQIAEQIQAQIVSGEIPEGFRFPSERQLADALGVNRTTILNAYKELKADGLMDSHVGRGQQQTGQRQAGQRQAGQASLSQGTHVGVSVQRLSEAS